MLAVSDLIDITNVLWMISGCRIRSRIGTDSYGLWGWKMVCCREDAILWPSRVIETMEMAALVDKQNISLSSFSTTFRSYDMHSDRRPKGGDDVIVGSLMFQSPPAEPTIRCRVPSIFSFFFSFAFLSSQLLMQTFPSAFPRKKRRFA